MSILLLQNNIPETTVLPRSAYGFQMRYISLYLSLKIKLL